MSARLSDVKKYIETIKGELDSILFSINNIIETACKENDIPIYSTKIRIKSPESAFLKIKKDNGKTTLSDITDYAGYRILCLFEQDVYRVHEYLYNAFFKYKSYQMQEIRVFNWDLFHESVKSYDTHHLLKDPITKGSGYKSVHYILKCDNEQRYVEIQLRTLVQDVWGELEHHMAYKQGNVHHHIKNSFTLLSEQLGTIDKLLSNLKDIKEKERKMELFSVGMRGPTFYLCYETDILPKLFIEDTEAAELYNEYEDHNRGIDLKNKEKWIKTARKSYAKLLSLSHRELGNHADESEEANNIKYWQNMEKAFLLFFEGKFAKAVKIYEDELIKNVTTDENDITNPDRYVVNFRLGEIYFNQGKIEKALEYFDTCEDIMKKYSLKATGLISRCTRKNRYHVKRKLSTIYWLLGQDYIDITIQEILAAEKLYDELVAEQALLFGESARLSLINSLCYYHLEKFIILSRTEPKPELAREHEFECGRVYGEAQKYFVELENYLGKDNCTGNVYDTAAWFCYHKYLKSGRSDTDSLKLAKKYCENCFEKENSAVLKLTSLNLQLSHTQEIMAAT